MKTFRDLPKDGVTGEWKFSISDSGYSNCDVMLEVVEDLDNYVIEKQIPKPVILFMDGFKGHYGIEINEECDKQGIQLWLLRAHMSHIIQPADVVMFNAEWGRDCCFLCLVWSVMAVAQLPVWTGGKAPHS